MANAAVSSHGTTYLIVAVVLIACVGVVGFLPILDCPIHSYWEYIGPPCERCDGRSRITLFNRWREGGLPPVVWEGKKLNWIEGHGFEATNFRLALDHADLFGGLPLSNDKRIAAAKALLATGYYDKVIVRADSRNGGASAGITITVVEKPGIGK